MSLSFPQSVPMSRATALIHQPLPPLSRLALGLVLTFVTWDLRRRTRNDLAKLSPHLLNDVGIAGQVAQTESARPVRRN